jgi:long-chain fatty acid transport protein
MKGPLLAFLTRTAVPAKTCAVVLTIMGLATTPPRARGSAFAIGEQGTRAAGMGTAFTAIADDGSAIYYNSAGLAFQPGFHMEMDGLVVVGLFRFFPSAPPPGQDVPDKGFSGSIKPHFIPVASLYMSKQIRPNWTFGFGVFAPFGLSANFTNFNDGDPPLTKFPGRWAGTRAALQSFWFQPTIAHKFNESHAVGVGVALVYTHLFLEQSILNPLDDAIEFGREAANTVFPGVDKEQAARSIARMLPEGRSRIAGQSFSPGFSASYLYRNAKHKTNFGLNFRSAVTNHLNGEASFAFGSTYTLKQFVGADLLTKAFPNQPIHGSFTTPATYSAGVANSSLGLTLSLDFHFQDFTRFSSVPLNFTQTEQTNPDVRTPAEKRLVFDFRDSYQIAAGVEKPFSKRNLTVRAGYFFDYSPVVDKSVGPLFPDSNRNSLTVGASKRRKNTEFSLFYEAMWFSNRTVDVSANAIKGTNGLYDNFAHLFGFAMRLSPGGTK